MRTFDFESLEQAMLECEECGWRGKGYETLKGYASLPVSIELYCPVCNSYFGDVPRDDDAEEGRQQMDNRGGRP